VLISQPTEKQMFTNEQLHDFIIEKSAELGITGYDIGKNTSISDQSAYKILNRETKNPRRKNMLEILEYLESRQVGRNLDKDGNRIVAEPAPDYTKEELTKEAIFKRYLDLSDMYQKAMIENQYLKNLLRKNKIDFTENL